MPVNDTFFEIICARRTHARDTPSHICTDLDVVMLSDLAL